MAEYILVFDIGNTSLKMGAAPLDPTQPMKMVFELPTDVAQTVDSIGLSLAGLVRRAGVEIEEIKGCAAACVAPAMEPLLDGACRRFIGQPVMFTPDQLPIPLRNEYFRPQEVGADRLVSSYAAHVIFPGPAQIVVDFGTATTFDCVRSGAYLGGLICPGVLTSARALSTKTAKLPQIRLEIDSSEPVIGRSTSRCLNHGLVFGFAAMVEGLCERLKPQLGGEAAVIAAGGLAAKIGPACRAFDHIRPELILEGLRLLHATVHKG